MLPDAVLVAEGVKSAQHAQEILSFHPEIKYVQGLYLPGREEFAREWKDLSYSRPGPKEPNHESPVGASSAV